jgi:hypothetical protein
MSTAAEILARRDGRASLRLLPSLPAPEDPRHERVRAAVSTLLAEVDRLRALEKRDADRRAARAEARAITELALRKSRLREAKRHLMISIDRQLFWSIASTALASLKGAAYVELEQILTKIDDREKQAAKGD